MPRNIVQPVDSAGLLLVRQRSLGPEILLGRRRGSARAFPGAYVFPGGVMEESDHSTSGFQEDVPVPTAGLDGKSRRNLRAFARTALRECYEETGLLLSSTCQTETRSITPGSGPVWRAYAEAGAVPAFSALKLVARAITPVGFPRRFHSRFFMAVLGPTTRVLPGEAAAGMSGDGELEDVGWVSLSDTAGMPIADANAVILSEIRPRLTLLRSEPGPWPGPAAVDPAPCFTWRGPKERQYRTVISHREIKT